MTLASHTFMTIILMDNDNVFKFVLYITYRKYKAIYKIIFISDKNCEIKERHQVITTKHQIKFFSCNFKDSFLTKLFIILLKVTFL